MGLLDMLGMGGPEAKVRRLQKKASEKFGPKENRQGAIEELGGLKTEAAIEALLTRYTFRIDPGITDDDEKARVLALITQAGEVALGPVKRFISSATRFLAAARAGRAPSRGRGGEVPGRGGPEGRRGVQPGAGEEGAPAARALGPQVAATSRPPCCPSSKTWTTRSRLPRRR